jgi:hypothetical protein
VGSEEYHELVNMNAFIDGDKAVMNVGLSLQILHVIFDIGITNARGEVIVLTCSDQHLPLFDCIN